MFFVLLNYLFYIPYEYIYYKCIIYLWMLLEFIIVIKEVCLNLIYDGVNNWFYSLFFFVLFAYFSLV